MFFHVYISVFQKLSHLFLCNYETTVFYVLQLSFSCFVIVYPSMSIHLEKTKFILTLSIVACVHPLVFIHLCSSTCVKRNVYCRISAVFCFLSLFE